jgi:hypothetical protein
MHSTILFGYLVLLCIAQVEGLLSVFAQRPRATALQSLKKNKETKAVDNSNSDSDGDWDPYDDLLDLGKLVSAENRNALMPEVSISTPSGGSQNLTSRSRRPSTLLKPQKRWEHWTEWLQEELGDLDAELEEKDKWVLELRDIVEQKRGESVGEI